LAGSAAVIALASVASADESAPVLRNDYGMVGLIDMPSAGMAPDGQISVGADFYKNTQHYDFDFQLLPWLETNFLYTGLQHWDPLYPVYYDRALSAKARLFQESDYLPALAIGINDLVGTGVYSGEYLVATKNIGPVQASVGLGWGRLATADTIKNPLTYLSGSFQNRGVAAQGQTNSEYFKGPNAGVFGGITWQTPIDNLSLIAEYSSDKQQEETDRGNFRPASQFNFGASYYAFNTARIGLNWLYGRSLDASVSFTLDPTTSAFPNRLGPDLPPAHVRTEEEQRQAINNLLNERNGALAAAAAASGNRSAMVDALWSTGPTDISVNGRALLVNFSSGDPQSLCQNAALVVARYAAAIDTVNVRGAGKTQKCAVPAQVHPAVFTINAGATGLAGVDLAPPSLQMIDASEAPADRKDVLASIRADVAKQQIVIQALSISDTEAVIYYTNTKYRREKDAIDRLVRVLMADAPASVEKFRLIPTDSGVPENELDILRSPTERAINQSGRYTLIDGGNAIVSPDLQNPVLADAAHETYPRFSYLLFPQFRQELFDPSNPFAVQFLAGAEGFAEIRPGLTLVGEAEANIYDNFNLGRVSDSVLPHVRSDWTQYFTKGKNGIGELDLQYRFRVAPDVYAQVKAGYLESMFAGVGGEVLWRPEYSRWAIGGDLYEVEQRTFTRLFALQPYHVLTGHATLYYDSPWYGLNFQVSAGQYLAGDRGVTFQLSRRFSTGVEIGVFATRTNVSAAQFGEGSYDKGFIIKIPLDWTLPIHTQNELSTVIRPLQRDGGQRLDGDAVLYDKLRPTGYGDVTAAGEILAQ
jgi:hypothetical protein